MRKLCKYLKLTCFVLISIFVLTLSTNCRAATGYFYSPVRDYWVLYATSTTTKSESGATASLSSTLTLKNQYEFHESYNNLYITWSNASETMIGSDFGLSSSSSTTKTISTQSTTYSRGTSDYGGSVKWYMGPFYENQESDGSGTFYVSLTDTFTITANHTHSYSAGSCVSLKTCSCSATNGYGSHSYSSSYTVDTAATCTTKGSKSKHCTLCSAKKDVTEIAALGHAWPSDFTYTTKNNIANGARYKNCTRCSTRLHTQYVVYVNSGTGISSVSGQNWYDKGSTVTLDATVRTGYTWSYWACSGCGGTSSTKKEVISNLDTAHSYTAYATPNQYTYKISPNGGMFSNGVTSVATASPNLIYESGNWYNSSYWIPTRTGYTIQGLYDKSSGGTKVYDAAGLCVNGCGYWTNNQYVYAGNLKVYAQWKANTYTVVYNSNGGSGTTASQSCTYDVAFNLRANGFTRNGYEFTGWSVANDNTPDWLAGTSVKNLTPVNGGVVTLYACWRPYVASFAYNVNGGKISASGYSLNQYNYVQNASGDPWFHKVAYPNNVNLYDPYTFRLTKDGYKFVNWNTAANYTGADYYAGSTASPIDTLTTKTYAITAFNNSAIYTQDISVYLFAEWIPREYKVIYKANGGSGSDVTETWTYDASHKLYDNFTTHHFTKTGYYIDYWIVEDATDIISGKAGLHLNAGATYDASGNVVATDQTYGDLLCPKQDGRTIVLKAHWAPIKYKVQYNNDSAKTLIATNSNSKGYVVSTKSYTTNFMNYGTSYNVGNYSFTRSNKFGESTFLGYGLSDEDKSLTPKYYVAGKSPTDLSNKLKVITATDFQTVKTKEGTLYNTYFAYLNSGSVQTFNLYAVWDDCPGIDPVDIYSTMIGGDGTISAANTPNSSVRSGKQIEYDLLYYADNVNSLWDRESGTGKNLIVDKNHYYISHLSVDEMASQDTVTTYIVNYTIVDARGNKYTVSRKLYSGYKANIMIK